MRLAFALILIPTLIGNIYDFRALSERTNGPRSIWLRPISFDSDQFTEEGQRYRRMANRWYTVSAIIAFTLFAFLWMGE